MRSSQCYRAARPGRRALACALAGFSWWCLPHAANVSAAALQVSPIRLDLSAERPATALTLHNDGSAPLNAQVRVFAWTQSLDEDHLERTAAIVASPPIVQIAPKGDQTIRILRVGSEPLAREETYRLLIDEIPNAQSAQNTGVRMQLRYSVPVFVGADEARLPALKFALERKSQASNEADVMLRVSNGAQTHAQLSRVHLDWSDGQSTQVSAGLLGYALPGAARRWPVQGAPANGTWATLHAVINGEPVTMRVNVEPGPPGSDR
ncbi:molecular chaperone [Caballeronia sp. GAFFF2]|jgi:fimbrial chaperone protein|uniref:fimbrial biogenesis chaperone n=1 Tax=Caballeronia sp. GAFFF2 TaxID=2921741 RepID=UPI0020278854|nr:molecular chaperone [Caballeronia sp. GAFFF2]